MQRILKFWPEILLILLFFLTRTAALTVLPLHNDEGLHLTRAIEVWNGHLFFDIEDGKIAGVWAISLFYPQNSPVFAGRMATVLVTMLGFAGGMALARLASRRRSGGWIAGLLWLTGPYLFFFERMALADIEAGAAAVLMTLALLPGLRIARKNLLGGLALGSSLLFKISAAPFVGVPFLALLLERGQSLRLRARRFVIIIVVALIVVAPATLYTAIRGGFFSIARGWIGGVSISTRLAQNTATFSDTLLIVNGLWVVALIGMPLALLAGRRGWYVLGSALGPLLAIIVFGSDVLDRHFGVVMPLMTVAAAIGWAQLVSLLPLRLPSRGIGTALAVGAAALCIGWAWLWAWRVAYTYPPHFPLTEPMQEQYITQHPSGYGLREAVEAFPQTIGAQTVIASMSDDGCRRARFYLPAAKPSASLNCVGAGQGKNQIAAALKSAGVAYVLDESGPIGIDPATVKATWTPLAVYPRPGNLSRVTLWKVTP